MMDKDRALKIIRILYLSKSTVTSHSYNPITSKSSRVRYKYVCLKMKLFNFIYILGGGYTTMLL